MRDQWSWIVTQGMDDGDLVRTQSLHGFTQDVGCSGGSSIVHGQCIGTIAR